MARLLSRYNDAIRQHAVVDAWDTSTNTLAPISYLEYVTFSALAATNFAASTNYALYTAPNDGKTWKVVGVSYRFTAQAGSAATFSVEVAGAATAPGSGTAQTGALTLQGTTNTTINGTISTQTTFGAGSQVNLVVASTATTSLANFSLTLALQRVT
jgi:hypothetical protein